MEKKRLRDQVNAHLFRLEQELEAARDLQMSMLLLGIQPRTTYTTARLFLAPGETLYLYSDGVTEAHDPGGDLFCAHRLEAVLRAHAGRGSREVVGGVTEALRGFVGTGPAVRRHNHAGATVASRRRVFSTCAAQGKFIDVHGGNAAGFGGGIARVMW